LKMRVHFSKIYKLKMKHSLCGIVDAGFNKKTANEVKRMIEEKTGASPEEEVINTDVTFEFRKEMKAYPRVSRMVVYGWAPIIDFYIPSFLLLKPSKVYYGLFPIGREEDLLPLFFLHSGRNFALIPCMEWDFQAIEYASWLEKIYGLLPSESSSMSGLRGKKRGNNRKRKSRKPSNMPTLWEILGKSEAGSESG